MTTETDTATGARVILVLPRGWVVVGTLAYEDDRVVRLTDTSVIRRWGTTAGLGQLALHGPQPETVLDPCGTVQAHPQAIVLRMACEDAWS
ncbi:MAG: hypothetical protein KGK07_12920 [Chloroflexota bacterium]|nr:hypothetical protein [Chloroflexota bacterium]